ncbi:MAG: hypothetical protein IPN76_26095 [Saprospiraceae bacterium]|nr:hypothetical protein [Saprospiraceae bacterium]
MKNQQWPDKAWHFFAKTTRFIVLFAMASLLMLGCKKDEEEDHFPLQTDGVEISEKVINLDQYPDLTLVSSQQELAAGIYRYELNGGEAPNFEQESVLATSKDGGYLRKVTSVSTFGSTFTLQTTPGKLEDVIKNGRISLAFEFVDFSRDGDNFTSEEITKQQMEDGVTTSDGIQYEFNTEFSSSVRAQGDLTFNPSFVFDMEFENLSLKSAKFGVENTTLTLRPKLILSGQANIGGTLDKNLGRLAKQFVFLVSGVPVVMDIELALNGSVRAEFDAAAQATISYVNKSTLNFGVKVTDGDAEFYKGFDNKSHLTSDVNVEATGSATLYVIPQIYVSFYKSVSTVLKAEPYLELYTRATASNAGVDVCGEVNAGIDFSAAFSASIFDYELINESRHFTGPKTNLWKSDETCQAPKLTIEAPTYTSEIPGPECLFWYPGTDLLFYFTHPYTYDDGSQLPDPSQFYFSSRDNLGNVTNLSFPMTGGDPFRSISSSDFTYGMCIDWGDGATKELSGYIEDQNGIKSNYISWIIIK